MTSRQRVRAYIGLGSNLRDPVTQVSSALAELAALSDTRLLARSGLYQSAPLGPGNQPDYINAAASLETGLTPGELLRELQQLENRHGRERRERWGARTLDLDILLYGDIRHSSPALKIPHPQLTRRNFVLYPLAELSPSLVLPDGTALADLLANVSRQGIVRLADS